GYGLKEWAYRQELLPLIGYLQINSIYSNKGPRKCEGHDPEDKEDFPLEGHWAGDDCELIDEYSKEWEGIDGYSWNETQDKSDKSDPSWINISKQLFYEYNAYIRYWNQDYEDDSDE